MKRIFVYLFVATVWITQAYSQIQWTKDPNNPVLKRGANGTWDDVAVGSPYVIYDGTLYHMWYNGSDGNNANIGYATSTDKINWDKHPTPVLEHGPNGSWDDVNTLHPSIYFDGKIYHMWYTGVNGSFGQIGYATSLDSINWIKYPGNPVLTLGESGSWDDQSINSPEVLFIDGVFHMWYTGFDGSHEQIGYATSLNGIYWDKDTLNPVLKVGDPGSWDNASSTQPSVLYDGTNFHMWYGGGPDFDWKIGYAYSEDGRNWHKDGINNPVLEPGSSGDWDSTYAGYHTVRFNSDSTGFDMWYTGAASAGYVGDIGFAASKYKQNVDSTTSDFIVNFDQGGTYDGLGSSISVDGNGNFIVAWSITKSDRNIFARRYSETGTPLGSSFKVNGDSLYSSAGPQITANETGNFVITWGDESYRNDGDVYAQLYSSTGEKIGNNFLVNDIQVGRQWDPCVAMNNKGNFIISWYDTRNGNYDVYAQRYSSDGTPLSGNFRVNDVEGTGYHDGPSVTIDENDNFVVTWADDRNGTYDIYAQRYSSDGNPIAENFIVNTMTNYQQDNPEVSSDKDGNFVITWFSFLSPDYNPAQASIFAQLYSSNGVAQGSNFEVVSSDSDFGIGIPCISQDADGDFLIRWYDAQSDSPRAYAQVYRSNGEKIGEKFEITSSTIGLELRQATVLKDGKIYSTWIDTDRYYNNTGYFVWENVLNLDDVTTGIEINEGQKLSSFRLYQNYPNPFNPTTKIRYHVPATDLVSLRVYNLLGEVVATLVNEEKLVGTYELSWNAENLSSGVYFYKLQSGDFIQTRKMILLK